MKAQVSSILWTLFVILVVLVAFFFVTLNAIFNEMKTYGEGGQLLTRIKFVDILNRPYVIADVLSKYEANNRNFLEYGVETMVTQSPSGPPSFDENGNIIPYYPLEEERVSEFLDYYGLDYYYVSITDESGKIFSEISSLPERCGVNLEGFCENDVNAHLDYQQGTTIGTCNIGRIVDISGSCGFTKTCCTEDFDANKNYKAGVQICSNGKGTCSKPYGGKPYGGKKRCGSGRVEVVTDECKNKQVNGVTTDVCCLPLSEESLKTADIITTAEIPLFFMDKFGLMRISVG